MLLTGFIFSCGGSAGVTRSANPESEVRIDVSRFGIQPNTGEDAVPAVRLALARAREESAAGRRTRLIFPQGRYDFFTDKSEKREYFESNTYLRDRRICAIVIEGVSNLVLDGQGSNFIFHGPMQPLTIDKSSNIRLQNFRVDWDVPLTAQAQVAAVSDSCIDIRIAGESPYIIREGKIFFQGENWESGWWGVIEFARDSHIIPQGSGDQCLGRNWRQYRAEELEPGLVRLHHAFTRRPAAGNYLIMRHNRREHAGMFFFHSDTITVRDVDVYHTAGLGLLGQYSSNLRFEKVRVIPNARKNRYFSGHDDGIHLANCRGKVVIQDCVFGGLMDDPINVHGTCVRIIEIPAPDRLICRFVHDMSVGQLWGRTGETVRFIKAASLKSLGSGTIRSWKALSATDFEIAFRKAIPAGLNVGDALENLTWTPEVLISRCTFNSCRARGVLLSTPGRSIIENSVFRSSGAAILIAGDANQWYESGGVRDVLIRDNIFESPSLSSWYQFGEGIISIFPEIPEPDAGALFHRNIRIEHNIFLAFDYPVLYALSTDSLVFRDNTIRRSYDRVPWHWNKNMLNFTACTHVRVEGTRLIGDVLGRDIMLRNMSPGELTVAPGQGLSVREKE